jgi:multidrug efflux pump subunit AcrB
VDDVISDVRAKDQEAGAGARRRIPQLLQDMIGDLTSAPEPVVIKLFSQDPDAAEQVGGSVGDTIKKDPAWWTWSTASRTPSAVRPRFSTWTQVVTARAGFSPQEVELDASAMLQGEPATAPVVVNDRSYTIRVRFPEARAQDSTIRNRPCW